MKTKNMMLLGLMLAVPQLQAAGTAVLKAGEEGKQATMSIEYDDQGRMRMNMPVEGVQGAGYLLSRDGKAWMVVDMQGQTMVIDVAQMSAGTPASGNDALQQEFVSARPTGKKEEIAGFSGEVYDVTWKEKGVEKTAKAVLSKDPVVVEYSRAWFGMGDNMAAAMGEKMKNSIGDHFSKEGLGVLKMEGGFEVVSIKPGKIDEKRFALPKATMQMPSFSR